MTKTKGWKRTLLGVCGLAVLTVATWWLWLGWGAEYRTDPVTGASSGPYRTWQVVACVISLGLLAVVGGLLLRPWIVVPTMSFAFTVAWSAAAAARDGSGLWAIGAILIFIGMAFGSAVLSFGARFIQAMTHRPSGPGQEHP
jgi:hypothetical protein